MTTRSWWNGIHTSLRNSCPKGLEGSSPSDRTALVTAFLLVLYAMKVKAQFLAARADLPALRSERSCMGSTPTGEAKLTCEYAPVV